MSISTISHVFVVDDVKKANRAAVRKCFLLNGKFQLSKVSFLATKPFFIIPQWNMKGKKQKKLPKTGSLFAKKAVD